MSSHGDRPDVPPGTPPAADASFGPRRAAGRRGRRRWRDRVRRLRDELQALYVATRDPRTPWYAKALAVAVLAYAASPIDLIPDFLPLVGALDDLVLLPLGILLVRRLVPQEVLDESRRKVATADDPATWPGGRLVAWSIVALWVALAILGAATAVRVLMSP